MEKAVNLRLDELKQEIRRRALEEGFSTVGFTVPDRIAGAGTFLDQFLEQGRHGTMDWMAERSRERGDPKELWPEARSIIMLGLNYGPQDDPLARLEQTSKGTLSVYAERRDYHDVIKKKLKRIGRWLHSETQAELKVFVDTAPVMEKPLAQAAGLGWQGKHTNLVSREFGSWLFLGAIFTAVPIEPDSPHEESCGACQDCMDICPTQAIVAPFQLDARRCISYLTIEHKGHIDREFRRAMGNRIYGCDDCLAVCPWNKFAQVSREEALTPKAHLSPSRLTELASLDDAAFREHFSGTPIKRSGRDRFVRNVMIAIGNSRDPSLVSVLAERLDDASDLVRAMAVWALGEIASPDQILAHREKYQSTETDSEVRAEWDRISQG